MEIKAELRYPYTQQEKEHFIVEQNHRNGYEIREVERTIEYEEKVLEFEDVEEQVPIYDEEGEIIGYETVIVKKPIMIEEEIINPETGEKEIIIIQKYHYETREKIVIDLQAWGYTEEEIEEQKKNSIKSLTCTKRVFALMLKELGVPYSQLKELIASNEDAQLEWDLCVELLRSNPLLDIMGQQLGLSPNQLDKLFLYANGEITIEEFKDNE